MPARKKRPTVAKPVVEEPPVPAQPVELPIEPSLWRPLWAYVISAVCLVAGAALLYLAVWLSHAN